MAASGIRSANPRKVLWGEALVSASLEWLLIFMLVVDAIFSFVIKKFAYYCGLRTPCLICSRLDHVFADEEPGYYRDLICSSHKSEVSSLALCRAHNKLVDVDGMCANCLFSYATTNGSNAETYRLLVGKMGKAPSSNSDHEIQNLVLEGQNGSFSGKAYCSCCDDVQSSKGYAQKLINSQLLGSEAEHERLSGAIIQNHDELRKAQNISSRSVAGNHLRDSGVHPLSHVEYKELKCSSDTESEVHFSDAEGENISFNRKGKGVKPRSLTEVPIDPVSKTVFSESEMKLHSMESYGNASDHVRDNRLPILSHVGYTELKVTSDTESEVHLSDDDYAGSLTHVMNGPLEDSSARVVKPLINAPELTNPKYTESQGSMHVTSAVATGDLHALSEPVLAVENAAPSSNRSLDVIGTREIDQGYTAESRQLHEEGVRPLKTVEEGLQENTVSSNSDQQVVNVLDLGDAYKIVVGSKGRQVSGVLAEQWIGKDSSRVTEDLKLLLSQLSTSRVVEQSANDIMSPKVSVGSADLKILGRQGIQQKISLERNESGLSVDWSTVSEIEGESVLDRLKRQVEYDKKILTSLYKELEEERNASSIASDQAMAMMTRLQEEKAALQMEALQCVRMMEEQAEYDNEALGKIDDLLAEKEKEVQDLEAELDFYRAKYPNESMLDCVAEINSDIQARDIMVDHSICSSAAESHKNMDAGGAGTLPNDDKIGGLRTPLKDFEVEKKQILQCLQKLESTLSLSSSNGLHTDSLKGSSSENEGDEVGKSRRSEQSSHDKEEHHSSSQVEVPAPLEHTSPEGNPQLCQATDLASLAILASNLNKRLKALEAALEFLEQVINSLKYGEEGRKFIHEIASHLEELRKIGISKRSDFSLKT